jgi:hypothetical protein
VVSRGSGKSADRHVIMSLWTWFISRVISPRKHDWLCWRCYHQHYSSRARSASVTGYRWKQQAEMTSILAGHMWPVCTMMQRPYLKICVGHISKASFWESLESRVSLSRAPNSERSPASGSRIVRSRRRPMVSGKLRTGTETVTTLNMKNGVFWDVTPCGSCKKRRFGGT